MPMNDASNDILCRPDFGNDDWKKIKINKVKNLNTDPTTSSLKPSRSERRVQVDSDATPRAPPRPKPRPLVPGISRVSLEDHPEPAEPAPVKRGAKKPTLDELLFTPKEYARSVADKTKTRVENRLPNPFPLKHRGTSGARTRKPNTYPDIPPLSSPNLKPHKSSAFPNISPLSSPAPKESGKSAVRGKLKAAPLVCAPFPLDTSNIDDDDDELALKDGDEIQTRGGLRPFPMNTKELKSIESQLSPPRAGKWPSENIAGGSTRKKKTGGPENMAPSDVDDETDDDQHVFLDPSTDPSTLCPYCDGPLPSSATATLTRLLASAAEKSYHDPRPTNPLGKRATLATFIGVCQRHRFESEILPEGEARGWPKKIKWDDVRGRVEGMAGQLTALIADGKHEKNKQRKKEKSPREKCVFWLDVINEFKEQGSRAVIGVKGQFANFEKTQPGYYGELGAVIIHQTLYNLFPPTSFDATLIAPLTPNEFIQRILVPEVGVRLIMQDMKLRGDKGIKEAVKILRESATYGVAMFPEDGGEWNGAKGADEDDEMGAADMIVMERARKRRKELEEEEREEDEIVERQKARVEREPSERAIGKRKARENGKQRTVPRPKPKRLAPRATSSVVSDSEGVADGTRKSSLRPTTRAGSQVLNLCSSDEKSSSGSGSSSSEYH